MVKIKTFDPLDIAAVHKLVQQTSSLRLLALMRGRGRGRLVVYTVKKPDLELEGDLREQGSVIVGYYTRRAPIGQIMADIGTALGEA